MSGINQFLALGVGVGANTLTPTAYAALSATLLANGFQSGVAPSNQFNTAFRQTTTMAAAIGQLIADQGINANDDGSPTNLKVSLKSALDALYSQSTIQGSFKNLQMGAAGTNAIVNITADALVLSNGSGSNKAVTGVNLAINLSNTIGQPLAISTGTWSANTWYAIYVWNNGTSTTGTADPSGTSPTAPAGYSGGTWMRVGWIRTDGTGNKYPFAFKQQGRSVAYSVSGNVTGLPVIVSGVQGNISTPTWVASSISSFVPSTAAKISIAVMGYGGGAGTVMVAPTGAYGAYSSTTNPPPVVSSVGATARVVIPYNMILESTSIYSASDQAATGVACIGWEDNL